MPPRSSGDLHKVPLLKSLQDFQHQDFQHSVPCAVSPKQSLSQTVQTCDGPVALCCAQKREDYLHITGLLVEALNCCASCPG
jgi:hypothetical protein